MSVKHRNLGGHSIISGSELPGAGGVITGFNPATNLPLDPPYSLLDAAQLTLATQAAEEAFKSFSLLEPETHARLLEGIAENLDAVEIGLVEQAMVETGLPQARLTGERNRTTNQLRLFAAEVRGGDFRGVRIDQAFPSRLPAPRADIRQQKIPLGPVAVFGASNFPLAFSTAGGDTASALAAGCPVVFKAHNAHPGTSEIVGRAIADAIQTLGLHPGIFSLVYGPGASIGQALARDPRIKAVGFTGSRLAGTALMVAGADRPEPIPVYAEMSSINPVFIFPGALESGGEELAEAYVSSVTASCGQLCTVPGLMFVPEGDRGDRFVSSIGTLISGAKGQTMLSQSISDAYIAGIADLAQQDQVEILGEGVRGQTENAPAPAIFTTNMTTFLNNDVLHEEIFGAASLVVRYSGLADLRSAVERLEGQLTVTLHLTDADNNAVMPLVPLLERKAGRLLVNGWPTGVEVCHAMVHGGPFPASSDSRTTSVGTLAIERFLRPVAYQNFPDALMPQSLRSDNPWRLNCLLDGTMSSGAETV